jgi:hypothetical protein
MAMDAWKHLVKKPFAGETRSASFELSRLVRTLSGCDTLYGETVDAYLVSRAAREPEAFGELFKRHSRSVYAYCARRTGDLHRAEDLTSVVFLEAFHRRCKLQLSKTSALPWLLGVANKVTRNSDRASAAIAAPLLTSPRRWTTRAQKTR